MEGSFFIALKCALASINLFDISSGYKLEKLHIQCEITERSLTELLMASSSSSELNVNIMGSGSTTLLLVNLLRTVLVIFTFGVATGILLLPVNFK